jgi:DNA repair exonuclease SbcCD ATPase subunit
MIRRVVLTNWRAYQRLELDLSKPVTFIVAPNGVGKTSLVEAVQWGTFGRTWRAKAGKPVRIGAEQAAVELTIALPGSTIEVSRTLATSGRATFSCRQDGSEITEHEYLGAITEGWGAEPNLLLALLFGEAGTHAESGFPIREHLAEVFGAAPLMDGVAVIDTRLKSLSRDIKGLRAEQGVDSAAMKAAEEEVTRREEEARAAAERLTAVQESVAALEEGARASEAWARYRSGFEAFRRNSMELVDRLRTFVQVDEAEPEDVASAAEDAVLTAVDRQQEATSRLGLAMTAAGAALELLGADVDVCPTCLRPLSPEERAAAIAQHDHVRTEGDEAASEAREKLQTLEDRLRQVREVGRSLRQLQVPTEPDVTDPGPDAAAALAGARQQLLEASEVNGAAQARLTDARGDLEDLRASVQENETLVAAYREEAVLQMARDAFDAVAGNLLTQRIEPLAAEIGHRWKLLFGTEGLQLEPDGSLRFHVQGDQLDLIDLSGGERGVALFVTRLLVVASATRATTLWLDEPLEHLDSRRRAAIARTIVRAVQQGALGQVVVTTYEERLARQLAATAPDTVDVAHVRAAPPT